MQTNNYSKKANELLDLAKAYLSETNWTNVESGSPKTTLKKKYFKHLSPIACYILTTKSNKSVEELTGKIWDVNEEIVKKNDQEITMWEQPYSGMDWKVCHQTNSTPWPLYHRELVFSQSKIIEGNTTWLIASSVDPSEAKVPTTPSKYYLANVIMSIWKFTKLDQNETEITRIVHIEPNGLIPEFFVNASATKHVKIIEKLANE
ncbi:lipid-binding START domain-containing protein [Fadolivirus algeromassiliense]|jgi:hypothetical protein|uniref:Lipid-binding START domain-containing protein n=1 Tax=Fadolivirus FV1/VV64 TaxID=3070911 RepID=A0A7D3UQY4_9VIRU|nr:lipid-binding START domain-containing protein [Fadolivirus algeromassiliense]QKF94828.1 lipid-binding START domain-containing protein [Fadolivirus FV1/VV64]